MEYYSIPEPAAQQRERTPRSRPRAYSDFPEAPLASDFSEHMPGSPVFSFFTLPVLGSPVFFFFTYADTHRLCPVPLFFPFVHVRMIAAQFVFRWVSQS
jgi:hypothetical protein